MRPIEQWTDEEKQSFNDYLKEIHLRGEEFRDWLQKRIPQKPINAGQYETCPLCGKCIPVAKNYIYCGGCGQRLDRMTKAYPKKY